MIVYGRTFRIQKTVYLFMHMVMWWKNRNSIEQPYELRAQENLDMPCTYMSIYLYCTIDSAQFVLWLPGGDDKYKRLHKWCAGMYLSWRKSSSPKNTHCTERLDVDAHYHVYYYYYRLPSIWLSRKQRIQLNNDIKCIKLRSTAKLMTRWNSSSNSIGKKSAHSQIVDDSPHQQSATIGIKSIAIDGKFLR